MIKEASKICNKCNIKKNVNDFYNKRLDCKKCCNLRSSKWLIINKESRKDYDKIRYHTTLKGTQKLKDKSQFHLAKKYNLSLKEYRDLLIKHNNKCNICKKENNNGINLAVDHNHITGKVRGLLCTTCNIGIGYLQVDKNTKLLKAAIKYVNNNKGEDKYDDTKK
tara:strand:+ start:47 stop:541 length:495 start_codon:yes stop_codon:yes gene_type:complete